MKSKDIKKILAEVKLKKQQKPKSAFNPLLKERNMLDQAHEDGAYGTKIIKEGQNGPV